MSRFLNNSTPAERMRGCFFAETFKSQALVEDNGATVNGNPTFQNNGVVLDGTGDYLVYALGGHEFNVSQISFVIEFTPDFDTDVDDTYYFFDSTNNKQFRLWKTDNGSGNLLVYGLGDNVIDSITEATYSDYWRVGERNVIVIAGTSGDSSIYLNGNVIGDSDGSAWSGKTPTEFYIGAARSGGAEFQGTIHSLKVFNTQLTDREATDYYNDDIYNYMQNSVLYLPMTSDTHDAANNRTLDVSGYENHALLGDGSAGSSLAPTKLTNRGYSFDSTNNQRLTVPNDSSLKPTDKITLWCLIRKQGNIYDESYVTFIGEEGSGGVGCFLAEKGNSTTTYFYLDSVYNLVETNDSYLNCGGLFLLVGTYDKNASGDNYSYYCNGVLINGSTRSGDILQTDQDIWVGDNGNDYTFNGDFLACGIMDEMMTELQVKDMYYNFKKKNNRA